MHKNTTNVFAFLYDIFSPVITVLITDIYRSLCTMKVQFFGEQQWKRHGKHEEMSPQITL